MADSGRRRWFQFSLRTLLVIVLVFSLPLSWFAVRMQEVAKQHEAIELLESKGCTMLYPDASWFADSPWLMKRLCPPVYVVARESRVVDADLAYFRKLSEVEGIELDNTRISDAGLRHLVGLTNLKALSLDHTDVTDEGLGHLSRLTNLEALGLEGTSVTDAGITHLARLANLRMAIVNRKVTQSGVDELKQALPNCAIWQLTPNGRVRVDK